MDEDGEVSLDMVKQKKVDADKAKQRDVAKAIALEKKLSATEGKCALCFKNSGFKKHMMVALGEFSYLSLPLVSHHLHQTHTHTDTHPHAQRCIRAYGDAYSVVQPVLL